MKMIGDKMPEEKMLLLKNELLSAPDARMNEILGAGYYNPTHILLFSIFLGIFGIDRFKIGDVGMGIAKLLFGWATFGIWTFIDIFFSYQKAKEKNFNKVLLML